MSAALPATEVQPEPAPAFFAALGVPAFRRLWFGAFVSSIGTWTQDVALAWLIHTRLHAPHYLGLRTFAAEAPLIAFMLIGGAMADRVDRRRLLLGSQCVQMLLAVLLAVLYASDRLGLAAILSIAFITGLTQSQSAPTYQAALSTLVPARLIANAVALNSLQFNLSRAIGPVVAGLLLARFGSGVCFAVNALSFLAVIGALWGIVIPSPATRHAQSLRESLGQGLRHVANSPLLSWLTVLGAAGSLLGFPLITYLPVLAGDVLKTGAAGYSQLLSSFGAGAIVGALTIAWRGRRPGRGRALLGATVAYGLVTLAAVHVPWQSGAMALLFVSGVSLVSAFSMLNSLVQEHAPEQLRGRVMSIYGLFFRGGMPLGSLLAGYLVGPFGAPAVIGGFCLLLALLAAVAFVKSATVRAL